MAGALAGPCHAGLHRGRRISVPVKQRKRETCLPRLVMASRSEGSHPCAGVWLVNAPPILSFRLAEKKERAAPGVRKKRALVVYSLLGIAVRVGEKRAAAASGRRRQRAFTAAVRKHEDQRKPEVFSGHRKAASYALALLRSLSIPP